MKLITLLLLTFILTACGGGGSGGDTSTQTNTPSTPVSGGDGGDNGGDDGGDNGGGDNGGGDGDDGDDGGDTTPVEPDPMSITLSSSNISLDENTQDTVTLSVENAVNGYSVDIEVTPSNDTIEVTESQGTITVSVSNVEYHAPSYQVSIVVEDGEQRTETTSLAVTVDNTSGEALVEEYETLLSAIDAYDGSEIQRFADYFTLLAEVVPGAVVDTTLDPASVTQRIDLTVASSMVSDALSAYRGKDASEAQLSDAIATAYGETAVAMEESITLVNTYYENAMGSGYNLPLDSLYFETLSGRVSLMAGNPSLGNEDAGIWTFASNYAFLNDIAFPESATCTAE